MVGIAAGIARFGGPVVDDALSVEGQLADHLASASSRLGSEGLTAKQTAALVDNPGLEPAFRGERLDTFFKEAVQADPNLQHLEITPRFHFGPDVFDPVTRRWWDVTTAQQWQGHELKYNSLFGQGTPLYYTH